MDVLSDTNYSEWPEFILVSAYSILKCNGTETEVIEESPPTPLSGDVLPVYHNSFYGLTWDEENVWYMVDSDRTTYRRDQLALLGHEYLDIPGEYTGSHQIHYHDGVIAITCAGSSELAIVDLEVEADRSRFYWGNDHINSVFADGDTWWVNSNNVTTRSWSEIVQIDNQGNVLQEYSVGKQVHNIAKIGDLLYVCSSGDGKFIEANLTDDTTREISGLNWVRGLTVTEKHIIIGSSITEPDRQKRFAGGCQVHLLDRETLEILDTLMFTDIGPIHEIRGTVGDLAHNGIDFPGV